MPGFGSGGFGGGAFGEYHWSKGVLFDQSPEPYQLEDPDNDDQYLKWAEGNGEVFDTLRRKVRDFGELRDPLLVRTAFDETRTLRLEKLVVATSEIEQSGIEGSVNVLLEFTTERGRFSQTDVGKQLTVTRSTVLGNNSTVQIAGIIDSKTVTTEPALLQDSGPVHWSVRSPVITDSQFTVRVEAGDLERVNPGWVLTDGFANFEVLAREQFQTDQTHDLQTDREGTDGTIDASMQFVSASAALSQEDVGKRITLLNSVHSENNGKFEISEVLSATTAILDATTAATLIADDGGPLTWAILRPPTLTLAGVSSLRGIVEQGSTDGIVTAPSTFTALSAKFTSDDVGKLLTLRADSDPNNGTYEILAVSSATQVTVDATLVAGTAYFWQVRAQTEIGDLSQVRVRAPGLLQYLAQDFGVTIDSREPEDFQRRWVASVPRWMDEKGIAEVYEYLARLTGFTITVTKLYHVSGILVTASGLTTMSVGETAAGRLGSDGSITALDTFTSPTAAFTQADIGNTLTLSGTGSGNDGDHTILTVTNTTTVTVVVSFAAAPDANNGTIDWIIKKQYTANAPELPVMDEINEDLMIFLKGSAVFGIDKYCFETGWSTEIGNGDGTFEILSTTPAVTSPFPITFSVRAKGDVNVITGVGEGNWRLIDNGGTEYFVETVPVEVVERTVTNTGSFVDGFPLDDILDATGSWVPSDVGKKVRVSGSGSGNDELYTVESFINADQVRLRSDDTPSLPDANNGSLTFEIVVFDLDVVATTPPDVGTGTLDYLCPVNESCEYCASNRVYLEGTTSLLLEQPFERLFDRLEEGRPVPVQFISAVGQTAAASVVLTAGGTTS